MDFDALRDMVKTITRNKVKNIEVLGNPGGEASMIDSFYDAISKDRVKTDEEAAKFLYGKNESPKSPAYLRLKGRLERSLLNTVFFVDVNQPMFNERAKAFYNCYRDFAAGTILLMREARKSAFHVLEQVLEQAMKYEFVPLAADTARMLRYESKRFGDTKQHEKYSRLAKELDNMRQMEAKGEEYVEELVHYYIVRRSPNVKVCEMARRFHAELSSLVKADSTAQFLNYAGQVGLIKCLAENDAKGALKICDETLSELKKRKNANRGALAHFAINKVACMMQLRIFGAEVEECVTYALSLEEEQTFNWFRVKELYLHYLLFARRYEEALEVYEKTSGQPKFESLSGAVRDNWHLYGGYLHLLAAFGKLNAAKVEAAVGPYAYVELSKELEVLDDDKHGMNIPVVMLAILRYVATKGNSEDVSLEALEKYRRRYLDNEMNARSAAFLNMLIAYVRKNFDFRSAERIINREKEILASIQPQVAGQTFAVEIIPYEDLWEMMFKK
jgi:hypothetical protein